MIYPKVEFPSANANPSRPRYLLLGLCLYVYAGTNSANDAEIVDVKISCQGETCRLDVTLKHDDSGWDHYADAWRVLTDTGEELGKRVLFHPHVDEQPFTRSLDVKIPDGINAIWIEAHDSVHGANGDKFKLDL